VAGSILSDPITEIEIIGVKKRSKKEKNVKNVKKRYKNKKNVCKR